MLRIEPIDVNVTFPSTWLTMVTMQTCVHLTDGEPYRWLEDQKTRQMEAVKRTLEIARKKCAHFTLFPEYSVPGLDGITEINNQISAGTWPANTVVIGGIDGLRPEEYRQLCQQPNTTFHQGNSPEQVGLDRWINCCVTWVKDANGQTSRYVQPKICRAWPERNIRWAAMFCGCSVFLFKASYDNTYPCRFASFVCFDWIGKIDDSEIKVIDGFLDRVHEASAGTPEPLHWVFVLQENDDPNHDLFIRATSSFLTERQNHVMVDRSKSAVVFANNSARRGSVNRALTSCVFPKDVFVDTEGDPPTVSFEPKRFRNNREINGCRDVIFREQAPCIHLFNIRVIQFLGLTQVDRCHPVENAEVHSLDANSNDTRFPGGPVPACVKWVNDTCDTLTCLGDHVPIDRLNAEVVESHRCIMSKVRRLPADKHLGNIPNATVVDSGAVLSKNADKWGEAEGGALEHILDTLTVINVAYNTDIEKSRLHGMVAVDGAPVELVAVRGRKHEDCLRHFEEHVVRSATHKVLLVTRDYSNSTVPAGILAKFTVAGPSENRITRPGCFVRDYQTVLRACQRADSIVALRREIASYVA